MPLYTSVELESGPWHVKMPAERNTLHIQAQKKWLQDKEPNSVLCHTRINP